MKDRVGTDRDADALFDLFIKLGFYTNRFDNLKGREMRGKLQVSNNSTIYNLMASNFLLGSFCVINVILTQELGSKNHTKYDCLMVAILTHGINGKLYSTDGDLIPVDTVTE